MSNARDKANIPSLNFSSTGIDDNATSTAITIDSSENVGIGTNSPSEKLDINGTVKATAFQGDGSGLSGQNYPAFFVRRGNDQTIGSNNTYVKIEFPTEDLDTDNSFDNVTNYRFTPNVAGKYLFFASVKVVENNQSDVDRMGLEIRKNGVASIFNNGFDFRASPVLGASTFVQVIFDMNGSTDYVEAYSFMDSSGFVGTERFDNQGTFFGGYRIGA